MSLSAVAGRYGAEPSVHQSAHQRPGGHGICGRVPDPSDRRVSGIRISASGISLLEQAKSDLGARINAAIDTLDGENLELLLNLLEQFAARAGCSG